MHTPTLSYPPFWKRALADIIDALLWNACSWLMVFLLAGSTGSPQGQKAMQILFTAGIFVYWAIWESSPFQASPGKMLMKLKVRSDSGKPIDALQAMGRSAGKFISIAAVFGGILAILFSVDRKGWHDRWSKTAVVFA